MCPRDKTLHKKNETVWNNAEEWDASLLKDDISGQLFADTLRGFEFSNMCISLAPIITKMKASSLECTSLESAIAVGFIKDKSRLHSCDKTVRPPRWTNGGMRKRKRTLTEKEKTARDDDITEAIGIIPEYDHVNRCIECGLDMGSSNPRQFCRKTYCENI
jgi:hypothetical protein